MAVTEQLSVWPSVIACVAAADLIDEPPLSTNVLPSAPVIVFDSGMPTAKFVSAVLR
jgi:hypothetical protein